MLLFLSFLCHLDFVIPTAHICKDDDREWRDTSCVAEEVCHYGRGKLVAAATAPQKSPAFLRQIGGHFLFLLRSDAQFLQERLD